jgi:SOS-response transcriptional repressor LexA
MFILNQHNAYCGDKRLVYNQLMDTESPKKTSKLRKVLEEKGVSQAEFARLLGIYPQKVTNWINRGVPNNRALEVAAALGVDIEEVSQDQMSMQIAQYKRGVEIGGELVNSVREAIENPFKKTSVGMVPLIAWVRAGAWEDPVDNYSVGDAEEWLPCPPNCRKSSTFALTISGDSMDDGSSSGYRDGEMIFVDGSRLELEHNADIIVKNGDGKATFKRLINSNGEWFIKPLNPEWPEPTIRLDEGSTIIGRVLFSGRMR